MIRDWEFSRPNRTAETAAHIGKLVRGLEQEPAKLHVVRGTVVITVPDDEYPGDASPLADPEMQAFLRQMFEEIPHLLYFLADEPPLSGLLLAVAAFSPTALTFDGDRVGFAATQDALSTIAILERNAAQFARSHGEIADLVFGHLQPFDADTREKIQRYALQD